MSGGSPSCGAALEEEGVRRLSRLDFAGAEHCFALAIAQANAVQADTAAAAATASGDPSARETLSTLFLRRGEARLRQHRFGSAICDFRSFCASLATPAVDVERLQCLADASADGLLRHLLGEPEACGDVQVLEVLGDMDLTSADLAVLWTRMTVGPLLASRLLERALDLLDARHRASEPMYHSAVRDRAALLLREFALPPPLRSSDPRTADEWHTLAQWLLPGHQATIRGVAYTRRTCLTTSLSLSLHHADAWLTLGSDLAPGEQATIHSKRYTPSACFVKVLELDASNAAAWLALGKSMADDGGGTDGAAVVVNGQAVTAQACFTQAAALDPDSTDAWSLLAGTLGANESIGIGGELYTQQRCCVKSVEGDPKESSAWLRLAGSMRGADDVLLLSGTLYDQRACLCQAAALDPRNAATWQHLAASLKRTVGGVVCIGGVSYDHRACLTAARTAEMHQGKKCKLHGLLASFSCDGQTQPQGG